MLEGNQMSKQIAYGIVKDIDFSMYTKEFNRCVMGLLELEESKIGQKNAIVEKIAQIYQNSTGQYIPYLHQPKFRGLINTDPWDFVLNIFKQYQDRLSQRKLHQMPQIKPQMRSREHINPQMMPTSQNMNMNMVNMFLEIPNFQTIDEIETFQRKMFQIYKNMMPQVISSISMSSTQSPYYRTSSYQPYSMGNMTSVNPMGGLGGLGGMAGIPSNITGMSMGGMSSMNSMNPMNNLSYPQKHGEYFEPPSSSYQNPTRYFYETIPAKYPPNPQTMPRNQKNMMGDYRSINNQGQMQGQMQGHMPNQMQNLGFSYYGQRLQSQDFRGSGFKGMGGPYSHRIVPPPPQQFQRKAPFSQRVVGMDDNRIDNSYMSSASLIDYTIGGMDKPYQKANPKQRQPFSSSPEIPIYEPRKMVKKDDQVSIFNQDQDNKTQAIKCVCSSKKQEDVCFYCRITNLDPLNQVDQILKLEKITSQKNQIAFTIGTKTLQKINKSPQVLDIQIRCIKLEKDAESQNSWPDKARLSIDQEVIQEYIFSQSAVIKKKKQRPIIFNKQFGNQKYTQQSIDILLQLNKNGDKNPNNSNYLFGVFLVIKNSKQKMFEKMTQNIKEQNITEFFKKEKGESSPDHIAISPFSQASKKLLRQPVRGVNCTHPQCFDLKIYIEFLFASPNRQWKCPICNKETRKVVSDNQLKNILSDISKMVQQPKQIIFYSNGAHSLKYGQTEQQAKQASQQFSSTFRRTGDHDEKEYQQQKISQKKKQQAVKQKQN